MDSNIVHVEVTRKTTSSLKRLQVEKLVRVAFEADQHFAQDDFNFLLFMTLHPELQEHIQFIRVYVEKQEFSQSMQTAIADASTSTTQLKLTNGHEKFAVKYYIYELSLDGEEAEYIDDDNENEQSAASHHWILPSESFDGLWDSLIFTSDIQTRLMKYLNSALLFSELGVDKNLISWNKVILLHGPPGTGKTTLCKALAQKAAIRLNNRYMYGQLIEINSHSLFSKWFSESGKLVMKMFEKIHDLLEDPKSLVFLLIDEVESLAQCRQSSEAGNEPTDSIRAVNALLTQIDRIKKYPNIVILTTSNIVGSIDLAFVDRADLKLYIGPPPIEIIYSIFATSLNELIRVGIINSPQTPFAFPCSVVKGNESNTTHFVDKLWNVASHATGMSGRTLRKIPFLTHSNFVNSSNCDLEEFIIGMDKAVEVEIKEGRALKRKSTFNGIQKYNSTADCE